MTWTLSNKLLRDFENSHSSPGPAAESLAVNSSAGEPSAQSNMNLTQGLSCVLGKTTAVLSRSRFGTMFGPLTESHGEAVLTWFLAGFPVRTSVAPERGQESAENGLDFGERWQELWVKFDPDSCGWKTHRCLFPEVLDWSSLTLPRWGMMRDGELLELPMSGLLMDAIDCGFSAPTPLKFDATGCRWVKVKMIKDGVMPSPYGLSDWTAAKFGPDGVRYLNPDFPEWLMGWPIKFTALNESETANAHRQWLSLGTSSTNENWKN